MATANHLDKLRTQLQEVLGPAKQHYEQVGEEIGKRMEELAVLRTEQIEIRKLIRAIDPEFEKRSYEGNGGEKKKQGARTGSSKYSPAKMEQVVEWLRLHADEFNQGVGFYASDVVQRSDCPVGNQSGLSAILVALHEQGLVRLTKTGGIGGRKHYKVIV